MILHRLFGTLSTMAVLVNGAANMSYGDAWRIRKMCSFSFHFKDFFGSCQTSQLCKLASTIHELCARIGEIRSELNHPRHQAFYQNLPYIDANSRTRLISEPLAKF